MIVLRYVKRGDLSYVSHKDILRVLQRGLKRMRVDVRYSAGFVPHMLTYTTAPIPLGAQSVAEYFTVECDGIGAEEFLTRYNAAMPSGLRGVFAWQVDKNPNLAGIVQASDYRIDAPELDAQAVERLASRDVWQIPIVRKGKEQTVDIRPMIYGLHCEQGRLHMRLATGSVANLRVDAMLRALNDACGCDLSLHDVVRTAQLARDTDGNWTDAERYLI